MYGGQPDNKKADMISIAAAHLLLKDTLKSDSMLEKAILQKPALQNYSKAKTVMMNKYIKK